MSMRLNKFLAGAGLASRRKCEDIILAGRVSVNGRSVKPSFSIKEGDVVEIGFNSGAVKFKVLMIKETVRKEEAEKMYEIIVE